MAQLVDGIEGITEACQSLDVPVVSGNVSLYNETGERSVHPTPTVGVVGLVSSSPMSRDRRAPQNGDALVLLGDPARQLHGSLALSLAHGGAPGGGVMHWELPRVRDLARAAVALCDKGLVREARPVVAGGLAAAVMDIARAHRVGAFLSLPDGVDVHAALFGEDRPAILCVIPADHVNDALAVVNGVSGTLPCDVVGAVGGTTLTLQGVAVDLVELLEHDERVVPMIAAGKVGA
jgi:phosphoribosylformylglycinamidine synthase